MHYNKDEQRRFILWSISRTVAPPTIGPKLVYPLESDPSRPGLWVRIVLVVTSVVERLLANPRTTIAGTVCAMGFVWAMVYCSRQIVANAKTAYAYAEVERMGGAPFPNYPSRIVFRDQNMSAADLESLVPYLKTIPTGRDLNIKFPPCRVLDFTSSRKITESEIYPLMDELEMTVMLFYSKAGRPMTVRSFDLQRHQMNAERLLNNSR